MLQSLPALGFKCYLLTQSLRIPSETCASHPFAVTPSISPPHYLSARQQVFCGSEIRESWRDGAPLSSTACVGGEKNLSFHFQSLSSRLSHPQITAARVQCTYVTRSRLLPADWGLCFHAQAELLGVPVYLRSTNFVKWETSLRTVQRAEEHPENTRGHVCRCYVTPACTTSPQLYQQSLHISPCSPEKENGTLATPNNHHTHARACAEPGTAQH